MSASEKSDEGYIQVLLERARNAQKIYSTFSQEQVDKVFEAVAICALENKYDLAKVAIDEFDFGVLEDKIGKIHMLSEFILHAYKNKKTVGIVEEDVVGGYTVVAEPLGVIASILPCTAPTASPVFFAMMALKTRNAICFSAHPRTRESSAFAVKLIHDAAVAAGAPPGIVSMIPPEHTSIINARKLMQGANTVVAMGGGAMVTSAHSSGTPAFAGGPGNMAVIIDESANVKDSVNSILLNKLFDHSGSCTSEQMIIIVGSVYDEAKNEFLERGAYFLSDREKAKCSGVFIGEKGMNPSIIGKSADDLGALCNLDIKAEHRPQILLVEVDSSENGTYFQEILTSLVSVMRVKNYEEAIQQTKRCVLDGGAGHSAALFTDERNSDRIRQFAVEIPVFRAAVNGPMTQTCLGFGYNFSVDPSWMIGCGAIAKNSFSDNIKLDHFLNYKKILVKRTTMQWFNIPPKIFFNYGCLKPALKEVLDDCHKVFIVTDQMMVDLGYIDPVTNVLREHKVQFKIFSDVEPDPSNETVTKGAKILKTFQPDLVIGMGGGSAMDAAKMMRLLYEWPDVDIHMLTLRFLDIRRRAYKFPKLSQPKSRMVLIPTTSGTGSEVTPFAVITDDGVKYPIGDYCMTPQMAIVDPQFVMSIPKGLVAACGFDALTHAIESYVSPMATSFTKPFSMKASRMIFKYFIRSYNHQPSVAEDTKARSKMHFAATMSCMAVSQTIVGLAHSMAHSLGAKFHIPHGIANALVLSQVIRYNQNEEKGRLAAFSGYSKPAAAKRYMKLAKYCGLCEQGESVRSSIDALIDSLEDLKIYVGLPRSIKQYGIEESVFNENLEELCKMTFLDQCTVANPRYPHINEIRELFLWAYDGNVTRRLESRVSLSELNSLNTSPTSSPLLARMNQPATMN